MKAPVRERWPFVAGSLALLVVSVLVAPLIGSARIDFARVFDVSVPFAENVDAPNWIVTACMPMGVFRG